MISEAVKTISRYREADTCGRIEKLIRDDLASNNHDRIAKVVKQLCKDYAYDVHHPYARTGGLIGLAAASIALGSVCLYSSFPSPVCLLCVV